MRNNPFADALDADLDDDLGSEATLTMNGVAPSLDASDAHSVGDSDDLSDEDGHTARLGVFTLPAAEAEESEAVTQTNNKAASATKGKRKLSSSKMSSIRRHSATKTDATLIPTRL